MQKLDYVVNFTLDNGFKGYTEINETDKEGLELGFIDIYEAIDINWILAQNEFNEDVCVDKWTIEKLKDEDIIYLYF